MMHTTGAPIPRGSAPPLVVHRCEVAGLLLRSDEQALLLSAIVDLEQRRLLTSTSTSEATGRWFTGTNEVLTLEQPPAGTVLPPGDDDLIHALVPAHGSTVFDGEYDGEVAERTQAAGKLLTERAQGVYRDHGFTHDESGLLGVGAFRATAFLGWVVLAGVAGWMISSSATRTRGMSGSGR